MATNLTSNTGRGDKRRRTVHFDGSSSMKLKRERSGRLSGSAWRKQQRMLGRQKKMAEERAAAEEEEREKMQQMDNAYRILKTDGFEDRVLALVENNDEDFCRLAG